MINACTFSLLLVKPGILTIKIKIPHLIIRKPFSCFQSFIFHANVRDIQEFLCSSTIWSDFYYTPCVWLALNKAECLLTASNKKLFTIVETTSFSTTKKIKLHKFSVPMTKPKWPRPRLIEAIFDTTRGLSRVSNFQKDFSIGSSNLGHGILSSLEEAIINSIRFH